MAGHNKWSKIKRQKAVTDIRRSKVWARISRDITLAAREGGGDPGMNAKLALVVQKAKGENMPKENIARAIKRGTGEIEGQDYEEYTYEGYAPGGVAILVEALTDNTNRTVAALRSLFSKHGGSLGKAGTVAYLFDRKGVIQIPAAAHDEMALFELVAEAGAEDLEEDDGMFMVTTSVEAFEEVQTEIVQAGIRPVEAGLVRLAKTTVTAEEALATRTRTFIERLEEHQDVQAVYSNLS